MTTKHSETAGVVREPAWDIARLFPDQGTWSEEEYLELKGNRLVEFSNGYVEVLAMPTTSHQRITFYLCSALATFARAAQLGTALPAPLRVRLWAGKFREPDVLFMQAEHADRIGEEYWRGADLVMEVVSDDDRRRDLDTKRREYAQAGIPEYWIVDPREARITVLRLEGETYAVVGEQARGAHAQSALLPGFGVAVDAVFDAAAG
ncbi:MAG: Uma2 family endonuclease [Planctomycetes bacterium]|nr:Uma2 family endonuclease [Planctomycetota bacterium]